MAVASAYTVFGHPDNDRRDSCLKAEKFPPTAVSALLHLGYFIDTRQMQVSWPADKCAALATLLDDWLLHRTHRTPSEIAKLLGLLRHGAYLCPLGEFLSIRLQLTLSTATRKAGKSALHSKPWWNASKIHLDESLYSSDLLLLAQSLQPTTNALPSVWSRPIALLIPREPTCVILSDAVYSGLGGWSPTLLFMWRLTRAELIAAGFDMRAIESEG